MTPQPPLQSRRVRGMLAAAAVGVLVIGYLARPQMELPAPSLEEQPSPMLREVVQRRAGAFAELQETSQRVVNVTARLLVAAPPRDRWSDFEPDIAPDPARFGVLLDGNRVLGDAADLALGTAVQVQVGNAAPVAGWIVTRFAGARLALIAMDAALVMPRARAASRGAVPGDVVVGVAPGETAPVVVPMVVAEARNGALLAASDVRRYLGMPAFTANGGLLGILAAQSDDVAILPIERVLSERPAAPRPTPIGVSLRVNSNDNGREVDVVVDDVAANGRAAAAGLRPGDVLVSIDDAPVSTLDAAADALATAGDGAFPLRVRRGNRTLTLSVPGAAEPRR